MADSASTATSLEDRTEDLDAGAEDAVKGRLGERLRVLRRRGREAYLSADVEVRAAARQEERTAERRSC